MNLGVRKEDFLRNKNERVVYMDCDRHRRFPKSDYNLNQITNLDEEFPSKDSAFSIKLYDMIMRVLCDNRNLVYYQGFHDIATVLLLVMGPDQGTSILRAMARNQLKDFMSPDFRKTAGYLDLVMKLIEINDYELYQFMKKSSVGSVFCLSWILTWYAHNVKTFSLVCRLFDFFMVTNKYMSAYVASTLVMGLRDEIMSLECDMATVHSFLTHIPEFVTVESWEKSIESALQLYDQYPPESIFINGFGYFSYRALVLVAGWSRKGTNKTILRHSILNGTAKCIRKGFRKRLRSLNHKSPSKEYWVLNRGFSIAGISVLIIAVGLYTLYPYVSSFYS